MAHFFKKTANDSQTNESPLEFHSYKLHNIVPTYETINRGTSNPIFFY